MHIDILDEIVVDREAKETMHYVRVIETKSKEAEDRYGESAC